jgi:hypothetical protein
MGPEPSEEDLIDRVVNVDGCQVNETSVGNERRTMSALTKWNPPRKSS